MRWSAAYEDARDRGVLVVLPMASKLGHNSTSVNLLHDMDCIAVPCENGQ